MSQRGLVGPVGVLDHHQQRPVGGRALEQRVDGFQERPGARRALEAEPATLRPGCSRARAGWSSSAAATASGASWANRSSTSEKGR